MKFLKIHAEGHAPSFEVNGRLVTEREYELAVAWFAQARAEMREECARVADRYAPGGFSISPLTPILHDTPGEACQEIASKIAAAIRALEV